MKLLRRQSRVLRRVLPACGVRSPGVAAHRAPKVPKSSLRFACVALPVMCISSKNDTRVCSFGPDQDPRDVRREKRLLGNKT
eukprot:5384416-Prymnesium_polylepis.1